MRITPAELAAMIHGVTSRIDRVDGSKVPSWEELSEGDRQRSIDAVVHIMANDPLVSERGHEIWMELKVRDGWKFGPTYDLEAKTHPSLVGFHDLPVSERLKDEAWATLTELFRPYVIC